MPEWQDDAIVLSARPFGETDAVISLLTREHGRHAGLVYAAQSRRKRGAFEAGNAVQANWRARLDEQLGVYSLELVKNPSSLVLDSPLRLAGLSSACALLETTLAERLPQAELFHSTTALIDIIALSDTDADWLRLYVRWELFLLSQLGFGLRLESCTLTGRTDNLSYVSPRTGHAVGRDDAGDFAPRMLALPAFLVPEGSSGHTRSDSASELENGFALSAHFLERRVFRPVDKELPQARQRLADLMLKIC